MATFYSLVLYNLATEMQRSKNKFSTIWQQKNLTKIQSGNITRWQHFSEARNCVARFNVATL